MARLFERPESREDGGVTPLAQAGKTKLVNKSHAAEQP